MEVTYRVNRGDLWRAALQANTRHPQLLTYLTFPILVFFADVTLPLTHGDFAGAARTGLRLGVIMLLTALLITAYGVYKKMPSEKTERFCTERISPQGFECLVPEGHRYAAWQDILKITQTNQDLFVFAKKGKSYIVPKHAFSDLEQASLFCQTAQLYWATAKSGLPMPVQEGVWPPPPNPGASANPGERT